MCVVYPQMSLSMVPGTEKSLGKYMLNKCHYHSKSVNYYNYIIF